MASSAPQVFDIFEAGRRVAVASGVTDPESLVKTQPPPQPPTPPIRLNFSFTDKFSDLPADVQQLLFQQMQMGPSKDLERQAGFDQVDQVVDSSQKVADLMKTIKEAQESDKLPGIYGPEPGE